MHAYEVIALSTKTRPIHNAILIKSNFFLVFANVLSVPCIILCFKMCSEMRKVEFLQYLRVKISVYTNLMVLFVSIRVQYDYNNSLRWYQEQKTKANVNFS